MGSLPPSLRLGQSTIAGLPARKVHRLGRFQNVAQGDDPPRVRMSVEIAPRPDDTSTYRTCDVRHRANWNKAHGPAMRDSPIGPALKGTYVNLIA